MIFAVKNVSFDSILDAMRRLVGDIQRQALAHLIFRKRAADQASDTLITPKTQRQGEVVRLPL
jgi:hypothetical protein